MADFKTTRDNFCEFTNGKKYNTIYADPPWQFQNRTGKVAPENKKLMRYETMKLDDIKALPVADIADEKAHLYLWVPNALLPEGRKYAKTAARMGVVSGSILEMSQS